MVLGKYPGVVSMDGEEKKEVDVGNDAESTVTVSEHAGGESETLAEPMACEAQGEGIVGEEGGSCNGDDIMVEVLGSHVYVDGICTTDGGSGDGGLRGDSRTSDVRGGASDLGPGVSGTSGEESSNLGIQGTGEGSSGKKDEKLEGGVRTVSVERGVDVIVGGDDGENKENAMPKNGSGKDEEQNDVVTPKIVDVSSERLVSNNTEQGGEINDGGEEVRQTIETQKVGDLDGEKAEIKSDARSAALESSNAQISVVEKDATVINEESSNCKDGTVAERTALVGESISKETEKDAEDVGRSNLLDAKTGSNAGGEATEGIPCTKAKGMKVDAFDQYLDFPVEEQGEHETVGSTENLSDIYADLIALCQPTESVVGRHVDNKVLLNSEMDQQLKMAKCFNHSMTYDIVQVYSTTIQEMGIDKQVPEAKLQQLKAEMPGSNFEVQDNALPDSKDLSRSAHQVASGDTMAVDYGIILNAKLDCYDHADLDGILSCPGNDGSLNTEARGGINVDVQAAHSSEKLPQMGNHEVSNLNAKVLDHNKKGEQLKAADCLQERAVSDSSQVDLCVREKLEVEKHVADASLYTNQDVKNSEQLVTVENHCEVPESLGQEYPVLQGLKTCSGGNVASDTTALAGNKVVDPNTENTASSSVVPEVGENMDVDEQVIIAEQSDFHQAQEMEVDDSEHPSNSEEKQRTVLKPGTVIKTDEAEYEMSQDEEAEFFVSDLVWGKVRSHPWWPGQIFDPSDASDKAVKYHKKDSFLVAYFGDRTFAWNEASLLKPFRSHFSQVEKQSSSEAFQNAVNCALDEVSRRVELGLACSCISEEALDRISYQIVENTGIRQESSKRDGGDRSLCASSFEPHKLVDYVRALAESSCMGADRLDLVIAKAQLSAFYRLKGYHQLPEFQLCGGFVENDASIRHSEEKMHFGEVNEHATPMDMDDGKYSASLESLQTQRGSYHKRKHNLKDGLYPSKKERSLSELMYETLDSPDGEIGSDGNANGRLASPSSSKKRKNIDSFAEDSLTQEGRKTISLAKVSLTTPQPKPSFKIGECIRRAASQMTGSPSILKGSGERFNESPAGDEYTVTFGNPKDAQGRRINIPMEYSSFEELLSQLLSAACDPLKGYSSLSVIINFFADFRNSLVLDRQLMDKAGGKRKFSNSIIGTPETFEFEDMNDTYWTDRIVQNGSEEQPLHGSGRGGYQIVPVELEKPLQRGRKSRKRYSDSNLDATEKPPGYVNERAPAELVMIFSEVNSVPSELKLNKMFRHFGPLKESETEVDRETSRARVVFRRCSDAEVAFNSSGKFNIFGSLVVNYQLNYSISESFKASLYAPTLAEETQVIAPPMCEDTPLLSSTLGEDTHLISTSLGEEASFMVSTMGEETLPITVTFGEETLPAITTFCEETSLIAMTLGEGSMSFAPILGKETSPITLPIFTSVSEETSTVATTVGDYQQSLMNPTISGEHQHALSDTATVAETHDEQTSTVDTTMREETHEEILAPSGEQLLASAATIDEQTSEVAATTVVKQTSDVATTVAEQTSDAATTVAEQTSDVAAHFVEQPPGVPTTMNEQSLTAATAMDEEGANATATVGDQSLATVTPTGEEHVDSATNVREQPSDVATTMDEESPNVTITTGEETLTVATTTSMETVSVETPVNEQSLTPTTIIPEQTITMVTTVTEEVSMLTKPVDEKILAVATSQGEEASLEKKLDAETSAVPASAGEEVPPVTTTLSEEALTAPMTVGKEALSVVVPSEMENTRAAMAQGEQSAT